MRSTAVIPLAVVSSVILVLYGAVTVVHARVGRAGMPRRYAEQLDSSLILSQYTTMKFPFGAIITGDGRSAGTFTWGVLKLPVSHKESVGKVLIFLGFFGLVAVGSYVWRNWVFDAGN
jgi:ABC-type multidrug transport system permease subunit